MPLSELLKYYGTYISLLAGGTRGSSIMLQAEGRWLDSR
jgi:hypothetical protein